MENIILKNLLERGVSDIIVKKDLEEKLNSGKKLKVKLGVDPSGKDLTLGHMVVFKKLGEFQKAGHEIQLIFGNFTAQIGDPTDKAAARKQKTQAEVEENAKSYTEQIKTFIDVDKIKIYWNNDWLGKLSFADVVKLAQIFTVQQMMERDMYQNRLKTDSPIYMHEFLYPLMQGYDSVYLKSDLEIGGTDQTFNILAGRTMQKYFDQEPQNVLTVPILIGTDGKEKMGKSLNNYIGVKESPKEMFGKTMSIPDHLIMHYFELTTNLEIDELAKIKKSLTEGENPRNLKLRLAKEIVTIYHSEKEAFEAEKEFIEIFSNKGLPEDIKTISLEKKSWNIIDFIFNTKLVDSKNEIKRLIAGNGIKIDGAKVSGTDDVISLEKEILLQVGKRKFIKVKPD